MFTWLSANIANILIVLALIAVVTGVIVKMRKDKRKGKSACGCNCAHCAMHGAGHPQGNET